MDFFRNASVRLLVPDGFSTDQKGQFLEKQTEALLRKQSYEFVDRVRFTGMEIDLLGRHVPSGEDVYIECKFESRPLSANVIDLMIGQAYRRRIKRLALFSASPLGKEAKGALHELRQPGNELSFSFYGPEEILKTFLDTGLLSPLPTNLPANISDAKCIVHPELDLFWVLQEQQDGRPVRLLLHSNSRNTIDVNRVRDLLDSHSMLEGLQIRLLEDLIEENRIAPIEQESRRQQETVSRVATAETLIDYRPANPSNFIGRTQLQKEIWDYLGRVREKQTDTRVIALTGASGFGKSSLVAKLSERFKNKKWRAKYFLFPIDVRSARGPMFVGEALLAGIKAAADAGFVEQPQSLSIDDADNILSSNSIGRVIAELERENKVLMFFFDQFEEAFTKNDLFPVFQAFRRLALDVHAKQSNLVVGFSWRTGITLSDENPAYQMWNEIRDHRLIKVLKEFDLGESSRLISQFEEYFGERLLPPLRRRLVEQAQGLPWFLKKLCIHVYGQTEKGVSQPDLLGSRLNVKALFDEDLDPLTESQLACLKHIAANSPADSLEVYEQFGSETVNGLIEKRLIVRAGQKFAVYWDIFRDYLNESKVPFIPWTYIPIGTLRMSLTVSAALSRFGALSTIELATQLGYSEATIQNIVTDLQNLAITGKNETGKHVLLEGMSAEKVPARMRSQFLQHSVYQALLKLSGGAETVSRETCVNLTKSIYSGSSVKQVTLDKYFAKLFAWFAYAGLLSYVPGGIRVFRHDEFGPEFGKDSSRFKDRLFLGAATPESALRLFETLIEKRSLGHVDVMSLGYRNAAADLVALSLASWGKGRRLTTIHIDRSAAARLLADAVFLAPAIIMYRDLEQDLKSPNRTGLGLRLGEMLGKRWKTTSALRYANGVARYIQFVNSLDSTNGQLLFETESAV